MRSASGGGKSPRCYLASSFSASFFISLPVPLRNGSMNSSDSSANFGNGRVCPVSFWGYDRVHFRRDQASRLMSMAVVSHTSLMASRGAVSPRSPRGESRRERRKHFGGADLECLDDLLDLLPVGAGHPAQGASLRPQD